MSYSSDLMESISGGNTEVYGSGVSEKLASAKAFMSKHWGKMLLALLLVCVIIIIGLDPAHVIPYWGLVDEAKVDEAKVEKPAGAPLPVA